MSRNNSNQINVPEAKEAMAQRGSKHNADRNQNRRQLY